MSARAEVQIIEGAGGSFGLWLLNAAGAPTTREPFEVVPSKAALEQWTRAYEVGRLRGVAETQGAQARRPGRRRRARR